MKKNMEHGTGLMQELLGNYVRTNCKRVVSSGRSAASGAHVRALQGNSPPEMSTQTLLKDPKNGTPNMNPLPHWGT